MAPYIEVTGIVLFVILGLAAFVFWLKMLVQAATHGSGADKIVWVLIILFTGIFGAAIYFFAGRRGKAEEYDSDELFLRQMRQEFESNAASRRPPIVLTAEEERVIQEMRRSYRGDPTA